MHPKDIVSTGYDVVSYTYRGDIEDADCAAYHQWLDELMPWLSAGTPVLDLGCGCGIPVAKRLAVRHRVTGVDISPVQIQRARQLVPQAQRCTGVMPMLLPISGGSQKTALSSTGRALFPRGVAGIRWSWPSRQPPEGDTVMS